MFERGFVLKLFCMSVLLFFLLCQVFYRKLVQMLNFKAMQFSVLFGMVML